MDSSEEETFPRNVEETPPKPKQYAGLKPIQKGERRNPTGKNGHRARQELIADILDEPDDDEPAISRIRAVVLALVYGAKKKGDSAAGKTLIEQYAGKAKQQIDLSNESGDLGPAIVKVNMVKSTDPDVATSPPAGKADGS